jgi:hypothetical protein
MGDLSLADLAKNFGSTNPSDRMAWRMIPPSQNIEDRRGSGTTLADLAHMAGMWLQGGPTLLSNSRNPNMPSAMFGPDISNAVDQIKFETALRQMGYDADANSRNEAWLRSIENPAKE